MTKINDDASDAQKFSNISLNIAEFRSSYNEFALDRDSWQTKEPRSRDAIITELLNQYMLNYTNKAHRNKGYRLVIFIVEIVLLISITGLCILLSIYFFLHQDKNVGNIISLIASYLTFAGLIIGILKIVTEYVFPKEEEKYITDIVKIIQTNDLEHKKENIKAAFHDNEN